MAVVVPVVIVGAVVLLSLEWEGGRPYQRPLSTTTPHATHSLPLLIAHLTHAGTSIHHSPCLHHCFIASATCSQLHPHSCLAAVWLEYEGTPSSDAALVRIFSIDVRRRRTTTQPHLASAHLLLSHHHNAHPLTSRSSNSHSTHQPLTLTVHQTQPPLPRRLQYG